MSRKLVFLFLIVFLILINGVFVVNERQNVVVVKYDKARTLKTQGIYFAWPLIEKVNYIYTNERASLLNLVIESQFIGGGDTIEVSALNHFHVVAPLTYLDQVNLDKYIIGKEMSVFLRDEIIDKIKKDGLDNLNEQRVLFDKPYYDSKLGISIDRVDIVGIKLSKNN